MVDKKRICSVERTGGYDMNNDKTTKRTFWTALAFYFLIAFEFFYMASPFAVYFYSVYRPGLNFINSNPLLAWLSSTFLPHFVVTSSVLLNNLNIIGALLGIGGFFAFCIGAFQVYYSKLKRKGAVTGGIYNFIRHPQYAALIICSFGLLLLWPRYIVLLSFITMLFAYYFLAKVEEKECEREFGQSYIEYKDKTNMFLPFNLPLIKLPPLPESGIKRYLNILGIFMLTALISIGLANGLQHLTLNSAYALYSADSVYISVTGIEKEVLEQVIEVALADSEVNRFLEENMTEPNTKFINYVLPSLWHIPEIPMNPVGEIRSHYTPDTYDRNLYRIVFTKAQMRTDRKVEGKEIILNCMKRTPIFEVQVDLSQKKVIEILNPPDAIEYENIPVPIY